MNAIGVSNFLIDDLKNILDHCEIKPMADQMLCHISNTPLELIDCYKANGIQPEAYSPVAHGAALDFTISEKDMELLKHIEPIKDYGDHSVFPVFGGKL